MVWWGLPWSLELYLQSNARIARQGLEHNLVIHRILAKDTIDEAVKISLRDKADTENEIRAAVHEYRENKLRRTK